MPEMSYGDFVLRAGWNLLALYGSWKLFGEIRRRLSEYLKWRRILGR